MIPSPNTDSNHHPTCSEASCHPLCWFLGMHSHHLWDMVPFSKMGHGEGTDKLQANPKIGGYNREYKCLSELCEGLYVLNYKVTTWKRSQTKVIFRSLMAAAT